MSVSMINVVIERKKEPLLKKENLRKCEKISENFGKFQKIPKISKIFKNSNLLI